jgi:hypothetical protein
MEWVAEDVQRWGPLTAALAAVVAALVLHRIGRTIVRGVVRFKPTLEIRDQRRLIIPLQWLIENPFQNWTPTEARIIGGVLLWVDYTTPLEPLRREAQRLCEASPAWDRRVCNVQVTDMSDRAMQVRVLVSSASSGQAWDLRCAVREGLVAFLQREHPDALPRVRAQWEGRGASGGNLVPASRGS